MFTVFSKHINLERYFLKIKNYLDSDTKPEYFNYIAFSVALFFFVFHQFVPYGMNIGIIIISLIFVVYKNGHKLAKDFSIPIVLFYSYEILRSNAYNISKLLGLPLIVTPLIAIESKLFFFLDNIPNIELQHFFNPVLSNPMWYDYLMFFTYGIFFWFWAVVAFLLWFWKREYFNKYMYSLILFSFASVAVFIIAPTAPPWYASKVGEIEHVERLLWEFDYFDGIEISGTKDYGRNDFAAVPSLHAGWSFFAALYLYKAFGKKGLVSFIFPFGIAFATWYGAEHYVFDSIVGIAMASFFFWLGLKFRLEFKPKLKIINNY